MAAGQNFLVSLVSDSGAGLQSIVTQLQNITTALNALNVALTTALGEIPNANG
jgi:hypothetical protein